MNGGPCVRARLAANQSSIIMCKKNIYGFTHTYEVCPHCENEVKLKAELMVQTCPKCGKRIVTCSMCRACDTPENYCEKCSLSYQAKVENEEMGA